MLDTIESKLQSAGGGLVALLLLFGSVGYFEQSQSAESLKDLGGTLLPSAVALGDVTIELLTVQLWSRSGYTDLLLADPAALTTDRQRHDLAMADLRSAITRYEALDMDDVERGLWRDFTVKLSGLTGADEQIWRALDAGDLALAQQLRASSAGAYKEAEDACAKTVDFQETESRATVAAAARTRAVGNGLLFATFAVTLLVAGVAFFRLMKSILEPLNELGMIADKLAQGEADLDFGTRRLGELGALKESLRVAVDGWRDVVKAFESVAQGDATVQVPPRGPRDVLSLAVNTVAEAMREAALQADRIGGGDYTGEVVVRGPKDQLGRAFVKMTATLRKVVVVAERIAGGDLDVAVEQQGPQDSISLALNGMADTLRSTARQANAIASGEYGTEVEPRSEKDLLGLSLQKMNRFLRENEAQTSQMNWLKSGVARVNELVLGQGDVQVLATSAVAEVARHLDAKVGAIYTAEQTSEGPVLRLLGTYAYTERKNLANRFRLGEGIVGQSALERKQIVLQNVPEDYVRVVSGLGEASPRNLCVIPILFRNELRGVMELGTLAPIDAIQQQYIDQVAVVLGVSFEIAANQGILAVQQEELRASNEELFGQTRALASASEELRAQQTELERSNADLEIQIRRTQESESKLKVRQRELATINSELEERNEALQNQKAEIEIARQDLTSQAEDLALASKYKSEFLANMSHELRTPLNSLLLLARSLGENSEGNLTGDQRECATVIYESGNDLLNLINEILDLSKIEAGRMEMRLESVEVNDISELIIRQFDHMARSQGLKLNVRVENTLPERVITDPHRLGQVIKNLVGNALKFTESGSVTVTFGQPAAADGVRRAGLHTDNAIAIRVADTGIGSPADKQRLVFEAFQQVDSGDRRKYGGTGLGLSISRELVNLLGGELLLRSEVGVGSTFTIVIPLGAASDVPPAPRFATGSRIPAPALTGEVRPAAAAPALADDRDGIDDTYRPILIVEDDARFAAVLLAEVRKRGLKCLVALNGKDGLALAKTFRPGGVILDINLPDTNGWMLLSALKQDVGTRHIPVHIVSAEESSLDGFRLGAVGHAHKPLRPSDIDTILSTIEKSSATAEKLVLVVEDDPVMRKETVRIVGNGNVHVQEVASGAAALAALRERRFDLIVLDLGLPDMQGIELLKVASEQHAPIPPVIVYTVRELTSEEELALRHYADSIIIKDVRSQERLIDEIALFLHRVVSDLPEEKRQAIHHIYESDERIRGKKVLVVEDDMRTMFAMVKLLASRGVSPLKAANGEQALAILQAHPDVDLVLLDMMMPVMDGYETATRIRAQRAFFDLPVIALTAKAMKEDRQKCIDAGCSDYLSKPVDQDRLLSLLRVWLSR